MLDSSLLTTTSCLYLVTGTLLLLVWRETGQKVVVFSIMQTKLSLSGLMRKISCVSYQWRKVEMSEECLPDSLRVSKRLVILYTKNQVKSFVLIQSMATFIHALPILELV